MAATIFLIMATSALVALARHIGVPGEVNFILAGFAYAGLSFVVHSAWTFHKG